MGDNNRDGNNYYDRNNNNFSYNDSGDKRSRSTTSTTTVSDDDEVIYREVMDKLTSNTNISKWIELPMIAVMGDTSSGKSSVLSQLAEIELPANHTLTTKCPILLQLNTATANSQTSATSNISNNSSSSSTTTHQEPPPQEPKQEARIRIQWRSSIHNSKNSNHNLFQERRITKEQWDTIPQVISEAQECIIQQTQKEVAPDVICVQITMPAEKKEDSNPYPPLTLLDLPGKIQTRGQHERETILEEIEDLLHGYLQNPRCVILAILPANVDYHNSSIIADVKRADSRSKRTIPVITKPDLIDVGAEQEVLDLLCGKKISFQPWGFHMVKGRGQAHLPYNNNNSASATATNLNHDSGYNNSSNNSSSSSANNKDNDKDSNGDKNEEDSNSSGNPNNNDDGNNHQKAMIRRGGMTLREALEDEMRFFDTTEPWKRIPNRDCFGCVALRQKLAGLQLQLVHENLPRVIQEMQIQKFHAQNQILEMGPPPLSLLYADKNNSNKSLSDHAVTATPLVVERRRVFQEYCTLFLQQLRSSFCGKKGPATTTTTTITTPDDDDYQAAKAAATTTTTATSKPIQKLSAAALLHEACDEFVHHIKQGSLATIKTIVEGAQVIVSSSPRSSSSTSFSPPTSPLRPTSPFGAGGAAGGGSVAATTISSEAVEVAMHGHHHNNHNNIHHHHHHYSYDDTATPDVAAAAADRDTDIRGEVVHLDKGYACVDYLDEDKDDPFVVDAFIECEGFQTSDYPDLNCEENDVWSDEHGKVYIARSDETFDSLRKVPLSCIRTDPTWIQNKMDMHRTNDLVCFLNPDMFTNLVQDFIQIDWKPHCEHLVQSTEEILCGTIQESMRQTTATPSKGNERKTTTRTKSSPSATKAAATTRTRTNASNEPTTTKGIEQQLLQQHQRQHHKNRFHYLFHYYPQLKRLIETNCREAVETVTKEAYEQVYQQIEIECHPYTQDPTLLQKIVHARTKSLKKDIEMALALEQLYQQQQQTQEQQQQQQQQRQHSHSPTKRGGGTLPPPPPPQQQQMYAPHQQQQQQKPSQYASASSALSLDPNTIQNVLDNVFDKFEQKSVSRHMAEEMEIVLEAYGEVATKRILDRIPMICWRVFRKLLQKIEESLYGVTDETLKHCMEETNNRHANEFIKKHRVLTEEIEEMNKALEIVDSII